MKTSNESSDRMTDNTVNQWWAMRSVGIHGTPCHNEGNTIKRKDIYHYKLCEGIIELAPDTSKDLTDLTY